MAIRFTEHANEKLKILRRHGTRLTRKSVEDTVRRPDRVVQGLGERQIAERSLDETHVLRVVFIRQGANLLVITMYPARRGRY
jgi:hypothetical protein